MTLKQLTPSEFRQELAGIKDLSQPADSYSEEFREMASDFVLLLAICFNRRRLEATTIWNRIDSAIQKGLAECDGDDIDRLIATALDHVLANPNVAACQEDAVRIQEGLMGLPVEARVYFAQYLAKHRLPAITFGRKKWNDRKDELAKVASELSVEIEEDDE